MTLGDIAFLVIVVPIFIAILLWVIFLIVAVPFTYFYEAWKEGRWTGLLIAILLLPLILFWFYGWNPFA